MNDCCVRSFSSRFVALFLISVSLSSAPLLAQAAKPTAATPNTASGFSIETEMLTYRALESNGEAIACDIAAYLHNTAANFTSPPHGKVCEVGGSNTVTGVLIYPFDHNVFSDFQMWRSDMQTMAEFEKRGATACNAMPHAEAAGDQPNRPQGVNGRGLTATTATTATAAVGGVMGAMTPAGAMLSTGAGILGLFATDQAASPVGGNIEDQAFMDNVSRELRNVNIQVMMPSVYSPFTLTSIDADRSPFLVSLDKLLHIRDCIVSSKTSNDPDAKNIDAFLAALSASSAAPVAKVPAAGSAAATAPAAAAATAAPAVATTPAGPSHLQSLLTADGLAQRLGADPQTGTIPGNSPQHVLLIKALESGGSVNRSANIFGSKMSYSGGSVGTYALFNINGELECSGNVYDYAGYVTAKNFEKQLRAYKPDPSNQVIFQNGGCRAH